jgi:hypothetical protein
VEESLRRKVQLTVRTAGIDSLRGIKQLVESSVEVGLTILSISIPNQLPTPNSCLFFTLTPTRHSPRKTLRMSGTNHHVNIAIVGGGISGVALAIALVQRGLHVQIFEQARHFGEIGAGVAFNPAAIRAMKVCSQDVYKAFEEVATTNQSEEKKKVWFDWVDGFSDKEVGKVEYCFSIANETGSNAVHRAHFLDNLVKAVPEGITHFSKHVDTIEELSDGQLELKFHDGTAVTADAGECYRIRR